MKKLIGALLALVSSVAFSATLVPIQLLNPTGSTSGQAIVSTGSSSAPGWGAVSAASLGAQAANTVVANVTASSASPTAFAMPSCSAAGSVIQWTSGTGFTCGTGYAQLASPSFTGTVGITSTSGFPLQISASGNANGATIELIGNGATTPNKFLRAFNGILQVINSANTTAIASLDDSGNLTLTGAASAPGNDAMLYINTAGQTVAAATLTTVTSWTKTFDRVNANFNASTGTFTAPATGYYQVSGQIEFTAAAGALNAQYSVSILANGVSIAVPSVFQQSTSSAIVSIPFSCLVSLSSGQTLVIQAYQNSGASRTLSTSVGANYVSINRIP